MYLSPPLVFLHTPDRIHPTSYGDECATADTDQPVVILSWRYVPVPDVDPPPHTLYSTAGAAL